MKLFNIDLHISVIEDLRRIFSGFGHEIVNWSISGHNWVFGKEDATVDVINRHNWRFLDKTMCRRFYKRYKDELSGYDGFVVTHTPSFALLFKEFGKPVFMVASTRYEAPFSGDRERWQWLNKELSLLNKEDRLIAVANNKYDKAYCERFTEFEWRHIPSLCDYTGMTWKPLYDTFLVDSRGIFPRMSRVPVQYKYKLGRYAWEELSRYRGIVVIPYNASVMSVFEYYTANIPLFFPSPDFSRQLYHSLRDYEVYSELSWNRVLGIPEGSAIGPVRGHTPDPNLYNDDDSMGFWMEKSDWYDSEWMPFITYFDSFADLEHKLETTDLAAVSRNMSRFNRYRAHAIRQGWSELLGRRIPEGKGVYSGLV